MERPGDGRQEPSDPLPLSHTAFDLDATSDDLLSLYIRAGDSHRRSWQNQPLQATEQDLTLRLRDEVIRRLTTEQPESSSLQFDHYDTSTPESMSAKNKSQQQQYQLKSTDAPADQAKSLSQVSPGFIFVIFSLSSTDPLPISLLHFLIFGRPESFQYFHWRIVRPKH